MTDADVVLVASPPAHVGLAPSDEPSPTRDGPGALRGDTKLTLNTRQAQQLFEGRRRSVGDGKERPTIPGLVRFAHYVDQIAIGVGADDPYADWTLIQIDRQLVEVEAMLCRERRAAEIRLRARAGMHITVACSIAPVDVPLSFRTPYPYRAAHLIAEFDALATTLLSAHHCGVMPQAEVHRVLARGRRDVRRVFHTAQRYRFSGVSRADLEHRTARGQEATDRWGEVPAEILTRDVRPQFSVHAARTVIN